jgi:hypothetical protein
MMVITSIALKREKEEAMHIEDTHRKVGYRRN